MSATKDNTSLSACTANVKVNLFRTFCTPMYAAQTWCNNKLYSRRKLNVAFNDIVRLLLHSCRYHCASQLFANIEVAAFQTVIRNLIFKFIALLLILWRRGGVVFFLFNPFFTTCEETHQYLIIIFS